MFCARNHLENGGSTCIDENIKKQMCILNVYSTLLGSFSEVESYV